MRVAHQRTDDLFQREETGDRRHRAEDQQRDVRKVAARVQPAESGKEESVPRRGIGDPRVSQHQREARDANALQQIST